MRRIFFAYAWILLSVGIMLTGIAAFHFFLMHQSSTPQAPIAQKQLEANKLAQVVSGDPAVQGVQSVVESQDARAAIVASFLQRYNSPLKPHDHFGQVFVEIADKHGIDFRLLPAIAMQESNLCKNIPAGSYNCLGFGIHSRGTLTFESFEANFDRAARELKANYIDRGLTTPQDIMRKYTPSSDGSWANSVNQWMTEMRYNDRELGRQLDQNSNVLEFAEPTPAAEQTR